MTKEDDYFRIHVDRYQFILRQISRLNLSPSAKILDIGCYPPHLFTVLTSKGYDLYGISSPHEPIKSSRIQTLNIEIDPLPYKTNYFDLVIFSELIEHLVAHPDFPLSQIQRVLKPGGNLLLTTPNVLRFQNIILLLLGINIYYPLRSGSPYHRHNREYTQNEIKSLLKSHKFLIDRLFCFIAYSPFRAKNRKDGLFIKTVKILNFLLMCLIPGRRDTIFALATKPSSV